MVHSEGKQELLFLVVPSSSVLFLSGLVVINKVRVRLFLSSVNPSLASLPCLPRDTSKYWAEYRYPIYLLLPIPP